MAKTYSRLVGRTPSLATPKVVSTGTASHPTGNGPKPSGLKPKLAAPTVTGLPVNRPLGYSGGPAVYSRKRR